MQKTVIVNAHVISPGVDLKNAAIVIEGGRIKKVTAGKVAAISGAHGKSSTTALLAHILSTVGANPSFLIGAEMNGVGNFGCGGDGDALHHDGGIGLRRAGGKRHFAGLRHDERGDIFRRGG